jgi:TolB-like protein
LFNELKRRNVLRIAAAYVVTAWLIIQVVETIFPAFGFGDTAVRLVVIIFAIGFIPALVLAWIFELTPDGVRKEKDVDHESPLSSRADRKLDRSIMLVLALALAFFAFDKFVLDPARDDSRVEAAREEGRTEAIAEVQSDKSIAILPFVNMSNDPEQEYFSDGITEELLNLMARIPELQVISRSSSFSFKGKDVHVAEVAEKLGVAHILEGSVRKAGDKLRITAQLIDARTDTYLWSGTYDRTMEDVFAIQDEIAADVADRLKVAILKPVPKVRRTDLETYKLTLQARNLAQQGNDNIGREQMLLSEALKLDPDYVPALTALTMLNYRQIRMGSISREEGERRMDQSLNKALAVDPDDGVANGYLAWRHLEVDNDLEGAANRLERALLIEPGNAEVLRLAGGFARRIGRFDEAALITGNAMARDPLCNYCAHQLVPIYIEAGLLEKAEAALKTYMMSGTGGGFSAGMIALLRGEAGAALDAFENGAVNKHERNVGRAMALHDLGRLQEYEAVLAEQIENWGDRQPLTVAQIYSWAGENDSAFEWLDRAFGSDTSYFYKTMFSPFWRNIHDDPRWTELRERAGVSSQRMAAINFEVSLPE